MALKDNLISVWCEAADPTTDEFGANTLTNNNSVGTTTGKVGTAGTFTSAGGKYLSHADSAALSTGDIDFTIAAWVNLTAAGEKGIVNKWTGELLLYRDSDGHVYLFVRKADDSGNALVGTSGTLAADSAWHHVVAWHDSVNNLLGVSVDAGTADTASYSAGVRDSANNWVIGATTGTANPWDGSLNQVAFWKRVLTGTERTSLYNAGAGLAFGSWDAGGAAAVNLLTLLGVG
jgi:hypothetical protein